MIDLHCHLLPGIDDGAADLAVSLDMAKAFVADGVTTVACTPHIMPGVYPNTGPGIREAVGALQRQLDDRGIALRLVTGADVHIVPDFVQGLRDGRLLSLADTRYVLVEPPHHVAPVHLDDLFFQLLLAGYIPILTHPERLGWIKSHYAAVVKLAQAGVWIQITAGSLTGAFGQSAQYWAERMLDEGCVHILATDAHDTRRRPPQLGKGRDVAAKRVGADEAAHLVFTRPKGVLENVEPSTLPLPQLRVSTASAKGRGRPLRSASETVSDHGVRALPQRLWRIFK